MVYASFFPRFAALLIDGVILCIPGIVLGRYIPYPVMIFIGLLYRPIFESSVLKGSPGRLLMGLNVVDLNGERITFKSALIRYIMSWVSGAFCGLGYLMLFFTERKQTLHDVVALTLVVKVPQESPNPDWFQAWLNQFKAVMNMAEGGTAAPSRAATSLAALEQLHKLYKEGALTEEEYTRKKAEILNNI